MGFSGLKFGDKDRQTREYTAVYDQRLVLSTFVARPPQPGCKGLCYKFYPEKESRSPWMYKQGKVFCAGCEFAVKTTDNYCKCCGKHFRFVGLYGRNSADKLRRKNQ